MNKTNIEYLTHTLNLWVGCTKCSPGCERCWAEKMAYRIASTGNKSYRNVVDINGKWTNELAYFPERFWELGVGGAEKIIGINFMSDTFHENAKNEWIESLFHSIGHPFTVNKGNVFVVPTKRPHLMVRGLARDWCFYTPNVIFLLSVSTQKEANEKIPLFLEVKEMECYKDALFGLSIEPMLEGIDVFRWQHILDWIVVGGESGPGYREMNEGWVEHLENTCFSTPFYLKQMAGKKPIPSYLDCRELPDRIKRVQE